MYLRYIETQYKSLRKFRRNLPRPDLLYIFTIYGSDTNVTHKLQR